MFPAHPDWFKQRQNKRRRRPPTQIDPPSYGQRGRGRGRVGTGLAGGRRRPSAGGQFGTGPWNRRRQVGGFRRPGSRGNWGAGNRNLGRYGGGRRDMDPIPRRPVAGGGAPRPSVAGSAPHMPGDPLARPSRPKPKGPQPWGAQNTPAPRPEVPRRSPRRRSRVPYNRRGYGRRFDRFRRGLGRRRPAPIGGDRGRPRPGRGGGRVMGFAHPYVIARKSGYGGSLADWMQTEDGQKYQRNIDAGWIY